MNPQASRDSLFPVRKSRQTAQFTIETNTLKKSPAKPIAEKKERRIETPQNEQKRSKAKRSIFKENEEE